MALNDDIALLAAVPLFQGLDREQLRLIAFGAEHRRVKAGEVLFQERAPAESAYIVAGGRFELSRKGRDGGKVIESVVGEGTLLSELALATMVERKFTAVALEEGDVIRITRALFHRLIEEYPEMARTVENRIRETIAALAQQASALQHRFQ
ncbi:cyclic nucleotide-binding domain-containing protein [Ciceribacter sp. L1K22]|uniref:cyclic nucleotide-binding domain-containing protein n=1 Tax=Ciceribacter sp. L1K22 TaxID=2820275 RepID=UPI001ABE6A4B|nr:cyclic nucleotide-binding domain-containing protein [Ciceribacter sp. L1K22]MBO3758208.1 cyclic nucleotide-binding domain-containing protein [Ciceribacter sp. L1K22]